MIKAAIFDVDGTLLDSMPIWMDAGARYLKSIGIPMVIATSSDRSYLYLTDFSETQKFWKFSEQ